MPSSFAYNNYGILAFTDDNDIFSDTTWKCHGTEFEDWSTCDYDDEFWPNPRQQEAIVTDIQQPSSSTWIWAHGGFPPHPINYCRKKIRSGKLTYIKFQLCVCALITSATFGDKQKVIGVFLNLLLPLKHIKRQSFVCDDLVTNKQFNLILFYLIVFHLLLVLCKNRFI